MVVICLERGAYLHMAQLMPLPLTVSCFSKIQIGFTFLVLAHPGSPRKRAVKRVCVRVCVFLCLCFSALCCYLCITNKCALILVSQHDTVCRSGTCSCQSVVSMQNWRLSIDQSTGRTDRQTDGHPTVT